MLRKKHEGTLEVGSAVGAQFFVRNQLWYWDLHTSQLEVPFSTRKLDGCKISKNIFSQYSFIYYFQIFLAIALPLELPSNSAYFSYNFEANYALPNYTQTELQYPPLLSREVSRKMLYDVLELKLQK